MALGFIVGERAAPADVETVTEAVTQTQTVTTTESELPSAVAEKRDAILRAAEDKNYEALGRLVDANEFEYTFGGPVEGGPVAYWQQLAAEGQDPLDDLAAILKMPYTLASGLYVWPFAYDKTSDTLTDYERELLAPLDTSFSGEGYLGWRAGIRPDGRWVFFVAGD